MEPYFQLFFNNQYHDLTFSLFGYSVVFINNIITVIYGVKSESIQSTYGVSNVKLLVYLSFLNIPVLFVLALVNGEFERLLVFPNYCLGFYLALSLSCVFSLIMNASYFLSNQSNSSLYTQLLSNSKDIVISVVSYMVLQDFQLTFFTISGVVCSTLGACVFIVESVIQSVKSTDKKE